MQIEENVIRPRWITASTICFLFSTSYESWIQSTYLSTWQAYLLLYFLQNFGLFLDINRCFFFLDDTPQKVDRCNVHRGISMFCIFLHFFCSDLVRNSAFLSLDRIITESAICFSSLLPEQPRFQGNIPSINLVFNMIRCILLAFFQITKKKL